jgi:hypothetical protein
MDWKEVLKDVFSIAPSVASAVIAPNPATIGIAIKSIASAFGKSEEEVTPDNVSMWLKDPQAIVALKKAEMDFAVQKMEYEDRERQRIYNQFQAILSDMQSARTRDVTIRQMGKINFRADIMLIAAALGIILGWVVLYLGGTELNATLVGSITTVVGMFARNIGTAFDFEFGSSRSSVEKTQFMNEKK